MLKHIRIAFFVFGVSVFPQEEASFFGDSASGYAMNKGQIRSLFGLPLPAATLPIAVSVDAPITAVAIPFHGVEQGRDTHLESSSPLLPTALPHPEYKNGYVDPWVERFALSQIPTWISNEPWVKFEKDELCNIMKKYPDLKSRKGRFFWKNLATKLSLVTGIGRSSDQCKDMWQSEFAEVEPTLSSSSKRQRTGSAAHKDAVFIAAAPAVAATSRLAFESIIPPFDEIVVVGADANVAADASAPWLPSEEECLREIMESHTASTARKKKPQIIWKNISEELSRTTGITRKGLHCQKKWEELSLKINLEPLAAPTPSMSESSAFASTPSTSGLAPKPVAAVTPEELTDTFFGTLSGVTAEAAI